MCTYTVTADDITISCTGGLDAVDRFQYSINGGQRVNGRSELTVEELCYTMLQFVSTSIYIYILYDCMLIKKTRNLQLLDAHN